MDMMAVRAIIQSFIDFLRKELPSMELNVQSKDAMGLQRDVMALNRSMDSLSKIIEGKENLSAELRDCVRELKDCVGEIKAPEMPSFPESMRVNLSKEDIQAMRADVTIPPFPGDMRVSNLAQVVDAVDSLSDIILGIQAPDTVKVSNLKEIKMPKPVLKLDDDVRKALMNLALLGRDPKDAISVKLSDGEEFYKAMGKSVGGAVAMGPIPGNAVRSNGTSGAKALTNASAVPILNSDIKITRVDITVTGGPVAIGTDSNINAASGSEQGVMCYPAGVPYTIYIDNINKVYAAGANGRRVCFNYYV